MFTDEELKDYAEQFKTIGKTEEKKQKEVLEYFYQIGKIIFEFNIKNYDEKN